MSKWQIKFTPRAEKKFFKLSSDTQKSVLDYLYNRILKLDNPKLFGKSLSFSKKGLWRYRLDKFRIICKLEEDKLVVLVVAVAKRDVVYED
jgi:mRNA interferase RelE/StbE